MKNNHKMFILIEGALGLLVLILAIVMLRGNTSRNLDKVSVIVQDSDDNQWDAFKYGLRMAAEDQEIEMFVVGTEGVMSVEEQESLIEQEIDNGADAVIVQPVPGAETEAMLKRIENGVPVMLAGSTASLEKEASVLPVTEADNYAMGQTLAEEVLKDYDGNLDGKRLGVVSQTSESEAAVNLRKGFESVMEDTGAVTAWTVDGSFGEEEDISLDTLPKVDLVAALDDNSLTAAGASAAANNLHGAVVYGIGNSTEAVYYVDTGAVECLVVPDAFNVGYQSLTEIAKNLRNYFHEAGDRTVSHTVLRKENLFSKENQELLFTMSQ